METELPSVRNRATVGHPGANLSGWGSARINSAQVTELRAATCESLALTDLDLWADSGNSHCATDSRVSSDITASDTGGGGPLKVLRKSTKAVKSSFRTHEGRGNFRHVQAAAKRKARQKWLCETDDLAVCQDIVLRVERWAKSLVDKCHFQNIFTDVFSSKRLVRFPKYWDEQKDGLSQPWAGGNLWLLPPDRLWEQTVQKLNCEQGGGITIVPTCKDRDWWWSPSEVVVDWVDVPVGEPFFVDHGGKVRTADREYRIVVVDALGWTPEESKEQAADTADKQRAVWDLTLPRGDCVALHPHDCTFSPPLSHTHPKPSLESLMHGTSNHQVQQVAPLQVECPKMRRRADCEETKRAKSGDISQSESEASPGPDYSSMEESDTMHERPMVTTPPVMNETCVDRSSLGPREISQHDWVQDYPRRIRSVIKSDEDWEGCEDLKAKIMASYGKTVSNPIRTHDVTPAANKARGPHSTIRLELLPEHAGPRADKPIRAVGEREKALWDKIVKFEDRGMLQDAKGQPQWVARAFLVPKPGKNDWRLVIDYSHLNSCLKGNSFPLPVIEDQIANQEGNFMFSIIDLEDGFHQMHLQESSKHVTAFCTPFGILEWNVPPMGVIVGPAAYQQMVQYVTRNCPQSRPYIDDILSLSGRNVLEPDKLTI